MRESVWFQLFIWQESLKPFFCALPSLVKLTVSISHHKRRQRACRMGGAANSVYSVCPSEPLRIKVCSQKSGTAGEFGSLLIHSPYTYRLRGRSRLVFRSAQVTKMEKPSLRRRRVPMGCLPRGFVCQELCVWLCWRAVWGTGTIDKGRVRAGKMRDRGLR